jgi:beta-galactosidase GanA
VSLPALTGWRSRTEAPEAAADFDDSRWTVADHTTTLSPTPPKTLPVLYSDDYGYHSGSVWYRGHFTAAGTETSVELNAITGRRGVYLVWVNGRYLGSAPGGTEADSEAPGNPNPGPGSFAIPAGLLRPGAPATVSVLVQNMGQNDDWTADDTRFRQPRGLVGASVVGSTAPLTWRIQGARGGEDLVDPGRGPFNTGGLYGERNGWTLPGYPDRSWTRVAGLPGTAVSPGVSWYRTSFGLDLPRGQDTSVALRFDGTPPAGSRVQMFLNGWNVGQYSADIGPQTDFVLPTGLLRAHGRNTLAFAVIAERPSTLQPVRLVVAGAQRGGVRVSDVPGTSFDPRRNR